MDEEVRSSNNCALFDRQDLRTSLGDQVARAVHDCYVLRHVPDGAKSEVAAGPVGLGDLLKRKSGKNAHKSPVGPSPAASRTGEAWRQAIVPRLLRLQRNSGSIVFLILPILNLS